MRFRLIMILILFGIIPWIHALTISRPNNTVPPEIKWDIEKIRRSSPVRDTITLTAQFQRNEDNSEVPVHEPRMRVVGDRTSDLYHRMASVRTKYDQRVSNKNNPHY